MASSAENGPGSRDRPEPLPGGFDRGAVRLGGRVLRTAGPWTPSVHHLLGYLAEHGFAGAPRPIRRGERVDEVSYLPGETVGDQRPWPAWTHSDQALREVAEWLRDYHRVVADYVPPADARWRENHTPPGPDVIIAHNDAAPYNAVWSEQGLVGFVDWDMAGPRHRLDDLAWTAFSWVPLHARTVVAGEGFVEFDRRRERLMIFLRSYGADLDAEAVLRRLDRMLADQLQLVVDLAAAGDQSYRRMIEVGRTDALATARRQLRADFLHRAAEPE